MDTKKEKNKIEKNMHEEEGNRGQDTGGWTGEDEEGQ